MNNNAKNTDPFIYPVSRIGNEKNPKLIILLSNPGRKPENIEEMAESQMGLKNTDDGISGMKFCEYRKKCPWWDNLLKVAEEYGIKDDQVLSMEYYMYHTLNSNGIPCKKKWRQEAIDQLEYNKKLLNQLIDKGDVLIFAYYYGHWEKEMPRLKEYYKYSRSSLARANSSAKQKELRTKIFPIWQKNGYIQ